MAEPIGDVLAADAQGGAVLHQPNIIDVRHLGTTDALIHPAHHIAQNALRVIVQFRLHIGGGPVRVTRQRHGQDILQLGTPAALGDFILPVGNTDLMIMQRMQGGGGGRWYPSG